MGPGQSPGLPIPSALPAGAAYFATVFAVAFALGTLRMFVLLPWLGATRAVLLELPVVLAVSWIAARWCVRRFAVPRGGARAAMGAVAFLLLMAAELAMAMLLPGSSVAGWIGGVATPAGAIGLAGQVGFAMVPALVARRSG